MSSMVTSLSAYYPDSLERNSSTELHITRILSKVRTIAVTTFKCFLYDLASLGGLYRVASFVGLALALALVSLALQKYVLAKPEVKS